MTPKELHDELKRLAEKATPGKWGGLSEDTRCVVYDDSALCRHIAVLPRDGIPAGIEHNARLIVSLRNNLPTLLRALSALSALEGVKGALKALSFCKKDPENGRDIVDGLPDSHGFTLIWANDAEDEDEIEDHEGCGRAEITAGQIRRIRSALSKLKEAGL